MLKTVPRRSVLQLVVVLAGGFVVLDEVVAIWMAPSGQTGCLQWALALCRTLLGMGNDRTCRSMCSCCSARP